MEQAEAKRGCWGAEESRLFTRAVNALQRLSGHDFRYRSTKEGPRPYLPRRRA